MEIGNRYRLHVGKGYIREGTVMNVTRMADTARSVGLAPEDVAPEIREAVVVSLRSDDGPGVSVAAITEKDIEYAEDLGPADDKEKIIRRLPIVEGIAKQIEAQGTEYQTGMSDEDNLGAELARGLDAFWNGMEA